MVYAAPISDLISLHSLEKLFHRASKSIARCCLYLKINAIDIGSRHFYPRFAIEALREFFEKHSPVEIKHILAEDTLSTKYGDAHYNNRTKCKETRDFNLRNAGATRPPSVEIQKLLGTTLIRRRLLADGIDASLFQIRHVLAYFAFPEKITEEQFLTIKEFYVMHPRDVIRKVLTENTCMQKYGVKNFMELPGYRKNITDKYNAKSNEEKAAIMERRRQTNLELFGTDSFAASSAGREYLRTHWKNNVEKGLQTYYAHHPKKERPQPATPTVSERMIYMREMKEKRRAYLDHGLSEKDIQSVLFHETWDAKRSKEKQELERSLGFALESIVGLAAYLERDLATLHAFLHDNNVPIYTTSTRNYIPESYVSWVVAQYHNRKSHGYSQSEKAIADYIRTFYFGEIQENVKGMLGGHTELDLYLPEAGLAIEFNGCYWHSDAVHVRRGEIPPKERKIWTRWRHFTKYSKCQKKGIRLLQVFADDFQNKRAVVFSIIRNALGASPDRIFARKCQLKDVPLDEYRDFLNINHLQGYVYADVRLGLYYNGELVETIGINSKGSHSADPELVRLCTRIFTVVPGGFSRLMSARNFPRVVSYIDPAIFNGSGYLAAGFRVERVNRPVYFYVEYGKHERYPRTRYTRARIKADYDKGALHYYNPDETEEVNMYKNGFYRIWNCGTIKVVRETAARRG